MRILIGSDHFGFTLKQELKRHLVELGHQPEDVGCYDETDVDYPDVAREAADRIARGQCARGILVCGTGLGMSIAANKVAGVRAACAHDVYSAERARKSNNAQILALGSQIVGPALARALVDRWLESEFEGGRSERKVRKIDELDAARSMSVDA